MVAGVAGGQEGGIAGGFGNGSAPVKQAGLMAA